jgi:hypothetical protein
LVKTPTRYTFPRLLCLDGERRSEEADSENDREPDQPHEHLGWRRAGGKSS